VVPARRRQRRHAVLAGGVPLVELAPHEVALPRARARALTA
jgi:hypothetical protein